MSADMWEVRPLYGGLALELYGDDPGLVLAPKALTLCEGENDA